MGMFDNVITKYIVVLQDGQKHEIEACHFEYAHRFPKLMDTEYVGDDMSRRYDAYMFWGTKEQGLVAVFKVLDVAHIYPEDSVRTA